MRAWRKLPVVLRAVIVGAFVFNIGEQPTASFYLANLKVWPRLPWSVPFIALYLWLFWQYFGGRWWPASTSEARRHDLRGGPLPPVVWRWALLAGGLWMSTVAALHFVLGRFETTSYEGFYRLFEMRMPLLTLAAIMIGVSAMSGVVEEAAFRGYMQTPIERRHGILIAILVPSIVFVLMHFGALYVRMSYSRAFFILTAAVNYALLTHLTGSIRPAVVLHGTGDAVGVGLLWMFWKFASPLSPRQTGLAAAWRDPIFWLNCAEVVILGVATFWAYRELSATRRFSPVLIEGRRAFPG
jgi:membrane protease YdiL (CAAX protease family)